MAKVYETALFAGDSNPPATEPLPETEKEHEALHN